MWPLDLPSAEGKSKFNKTTERTINFGSESAVGSKNTLPWRKASSSFFPCSPWDTTVLRSCDAASVLIFKTNLFDFKWLLLLLWGFKGHPAASRIHHGLKGNWLMVIDGYWIQSHFNTDWKCFVLSWNHRLSGSLSDAVTTQGYV